MWCGKTTTARSLAITILTTPAQPGTKTGNAAVCSGDTRTYSVAVVAGITYNWIAPAGGNITTGQSSSAISITYTANFIANGTLSVTANNNCGTSTARTLTVARNVPASPAAISGPATICSGANGYSWTVPSGALAQGATNGNTINILWGSVGGNLAVRANNACGNSGSRSLKIIISSCIAGIAQNTGADNNTLLFPNPTNDITNVRFASHENTMYTFTVTEITGRKLLIEKQQAITDMNVHTFSLAKLTRGVYFVLIESLNTKQVLKINVQ